MSVEVWNFCFVGFGNVKSLQFPAPAFSPTQKNGCMPGQKYIWISFSRSGESPEGVAVIEKALASHPEIHHIVVSCNAEGRMIRSVAGKRQAFAVALEDAVNDRGLAMTSSFSNMVVFGQCMAHIHQVANVRIDTQPACGGGKEFSSACCRCCGSAGGRTFRKSLLYRIGCA